jgi:hypothetical protein
MIIIAVWSQIPRYDRLAVIKRLMLNGSVRQYNRNICSSSFDLSLARINCAYKLLIYAQTRSFLFSVIQADSYSSLFYLDRLYNCSTITSKSQESEKGHWHIPVTEEGSPDGEQTWLCMTRRNHMLNIMNQELIQNFWMKHNTNWRPSKAKCWPFFSEVWGQYLIWPLFICYLCIELYGSI